MQESFIQIVRENRDVVIKALKKGEIEHIEFSHEEIIDKIVLFAVEKGMIKEVGESFPDPRQDSEVPIDVVIGSGIIARLRDNYSMINSPYALNSAELISQMGYNVKVLEEGFNEKNKYDREAPFCGDVIRKILEKLESREGGPEKIIHWFNKDVSEILQEKANYNIGLYILDCIKLVVPLNNANYENSGIVKIEDKLYRGYKVGLIRGLLDSKGIILGIVISPINVHDFELTKDFVLKFPYFKAGDSLIEDRGFIDGETISDLKEKRGIDVYIPLKEGMDAYKEAVAFATMEENGWERHPTRNNQEIKLVRNVAHTWDECRVKLNACVVREWNRDKGCYDYHVFSTTNLHTNAKNIIKTYQLRPEIEEDFRQLKLFNGIAKFTSTKYIQVVYHIAMTLITYNFYNIYQNTEEGEKLRGKSLKTLRYRRKRIFNPTLIVYNNSHYALIKFADLMRIILVLPYKIRMKFLRLINEAEEIDIKFSERMFAT